MCISGRVLRWPALVYLSLQIIYSQPYARQRLTLRQVRELAARIEGPPHIWTTEALSRGRCDRHRDAKGQDLHLTADAQ